VTFESCDKILFKIHRNNLKTHSEGFTPPDGTLSPNAEVVSLSERAQVLELLFQYMYPQRPPDLRKLDFKVLADVAEAVEKYQVYAAMEICNIRMEYASHLKISVTNPALTIETSELPIRSIHSRSCFTRPSTDILS
jgi:hypothetical protein